MRINQEIRKYFILFNGLIEHELYGEGKYTISCFYPISITPHYIISLNKGEENKIFSYTIKAEGGYYYV